MILFFPINREMIRERDVRVEYENEEARIKLVEIYLVKKCMFRL